MPVPSNTVSSINFPRLLCVDDDERFLKVFTFFLQEVGFEVLSTTDPDKAMELASSFPIPDLAILDFQMPRCSGTELASILKTLRPDLPILIFSGSPEVTMINSRSIDAIYCKGWPVAGLIAKIRELAPPAPRSLLLTPMTHRDLT